MLAQVSSLPPLAVKRVTDMGRWNVVEVVFIALNHNVTMAGKIWLILMVLLRVLTLLLMGFPLYSDERESFACNTIQPGCSNACYDTFSPISLLRFWLLQVLVLCLPYALYLAHVVHRVVSDLASMTTSPGSGRQSRLFGSTRETFLEVTSRDDTAAPTNGGKCHTFVLAYTIHVSTRIALEAGFGVGQYFLFGLSIPKSFLCYEVPCTSMVECYISKPTEKTVMLNFMLAVSALCFLVNSADLICTVGWSVSLRGRPRRAASPSCTDEGASLCLEEVDPSPDPQDLSGLASGDIQQNNQTQENYGAEQGSDKAACCLRNHMGVLQCTCSTHPNSVLSTNPTWDPPGGAESSRLIHSNWVDKYTPALVTSDLQSDKREKPGRRAWV